MANQPQNEPEHRGQIILTTQEYQEITQGPLPDPDILARYKNADPSFPERIMKMAEAHNAADVLTKKEFPMLI